MDYFIIFITTAAGLYFHWWLFVRIRRWSDRDLSPTAHREAETAKAHRG